MTAADIIHTAVTYLVYYSNTNRAGHGGARRTTADQGEARRTGEYVCYCILCYGMQGAMSVAGPLPLPTIAGVWERRRRAGWGIGRNINIQIR
jgi:hypothetical protein